MPNFLSRLLRVYPGEERIVLVLGFLLMGNALALELSDVVAVSGFLDQVDASLILVVWIVDMVVILFTAGLQSLIVDRFERVQLVRGMALVAALAYAFLRLLFMIPGLDWLNYSLLYVLSDQQWLFVPLVIWVLANDMCDMAQAKRLFPLIAIGNFVGQVLGLGIAAISPAILGQWGIRTVEVLFLNATLGVVMYLIALRGLRDVRVRKTAGNSASPRETLSEGMGFIREVPSFRYMTIAMLALAMAVAVIEFRFLVVSDRELANADVFQTFYSLYRLGVTVIAILIQSFVTSRLIEKLTLKNIFLILPITALVCLAGMIVSPGLAISTAGIVLARLAQETIDESARKAFQALVPEERRGRVSVFMESYLLAVGTIVGCLIAGVMLLIGGRLVGAAHFYFYLGAALAATLGALWAILQMRRVYDSSLLNWRLKRRQRGASVLDKLEF